MSFTESVNPSPDARAGREFFESQLVRLGLTPSQINEQPLDQLRRSLVDINDAIAHPDNFGVLKVRYTPRMSALLGGADSAHVEVGILSVLLERRSLINERIRALELGDEVAGIREKLAEVGSDADVRAELERQLEEKRAAEQAAASAAQAATEAQLRAEAELKLEMQAKKAQIYLSWLQREPVAVLVGGVLLVVLAGVLIVAMFTGVPVAEIVSSAFLLILGYFFGQASSRSTNSS
ncbi:hypothetical protein [Kutzneria sp. 744]|uniref:hypothetical protein n=1 Tax=Kutzneria sp. (strain 744) TaxID=345341 RepID=UPI0003EED21F|nr:hypothetical protein [Kutzneria sp. 744]EWM18028.1 hypothetical protein KUTG_08332 [Kutzneria sp. 744]